MYIPLCCASRVGVSLALFLPRLSYATKDQDFTLGGGGGGGGGTFFLDSKHICVKQTLCKSRPSRWVWGHAPPPQENF